MRTVGFPLSLSVAGRPLLELPHCEGMSTPYRHPLVLRTVHTGGHADGARLF